MTRKEISVTSRARPVGFFLFLIVACCAEQRVASFCPPPPILKTTRYTLAASDENARAGADGYSVLRQPVSWNPNTDPDFAVPSTLLDEPQKVDDDWWSNRKVELKPRSSTTTVASVVVQEIEKENINLFQRSLDTLDYPRVLGALREQCTTVPGRSLVQEALQMDDGQQKKKKPNRKIPQYQQQAYQPLTADTLEGSQERYRAVQEMQWLVEGWNGEVRLDDYNYRNRKGYKENLGPPPFGGNSFDLVQLLEEAKGKVLEGPDIYEISSMLDVMENILCWSDDGLQKVEEAEFVELPKLASCITVNATLQDLLHNAFDKDGRLSGTSFPMVGRLRSRVRSLKADIMSTLDTLVAMPSIKSKLSLESGGPLYSEVNGGRLVVPIDSKHASSVGIVHDTSRSGKTAYVEPTELVGPTNELRAAEGELRSEEARIWRSLTEQILHNRPTLEASVAAVGQLDLVLARLLLGRTLSGVIPMVQNEGVISLRNAKHPVLVLLKKDSVVGSDVDLGEDGNQGLVLTGPNAGGKTIILKLLGLLALMTRGGIPVPADPAWNGDEYQPRVDFFNPVLADIGDIQSVGGDLSTFSGHMLVCREVLANSGKNALVLMDELGSGTDPAQGVAIAQALLEALVETGARVAITTHYMQLKQLAASDDRFAVAGMQFVRGRPTYRLLPGTVGESFALAVAERLELPAKVIERANELLDSETRQMGDLIRELEDQKAVLDEQVTEMEEKRKEMAQMQFKLKEESLRLENKQLNARRDEARKFAKKLEEKERILEDILERLKKDPSRKIVAKSWDDVKFVKRDALNEAENTPSVLARKEKAAAAFEEAQAEMVPIAEMREKPNLSEGDAVVVCKEGPLFGRQASVVKTLGGRIEVRVNNMNVSLKLAEVSLPTTRGTTIASDKTEKKRSVSKAAERAIATEMNGKQRGNWEPSSSDQKTTEKPSLAMRTESNTVDGKTRPRELSLGAVSCIICCCDVISYICRI
jgi:DNA mismatch repair protein MutS2